ncbi:uncharacterized protein LOC111130861 [Crassostrea virginica]|uniref:Uncharacterized protein LOC111130861 n=1 Tax=Crassostrea virginica TaxID=6565 RepID=A0A8B8E3E6_CRAVI|nr:uncharacterized protein LOC111130861 [Crassostrea virginica]
MRTLLGAGLVFISLCVASIWAQVNICKHDACKPFVETCFPWDNPDGYICCEWSSARGQYIKRVRDPLRGEVILNCAPLKCQVCSSADKKHGDKCGRTFGYSTEEAKQAGVLVSCDDIGVKNARACGKMITNNYFGEEIVTRYCYNTTSLTKSWHPAGCAEYNMMDTCYCNKEGCNSQEALRTTSAVLLFTTILAKVFIFRF